MSRIGGVVDYIDRVGAMGTCDMDKGMRLVPIASPTMMASERQMLFQCEQKIAVLIKRIAQRIIKTIAKLRISETSYVNDYDCQLDEYLSLIKNSSTSDKLSTETILTILVYKYSDYK